MVPNVELHILTIHFEPPKWGQPLYKGHGLKISLYGGYTVVTSNHTNPATFVGLPAWLEYQGFTVHTVHVTITWWWCHMEVSHLTYM